ncbi:hypothetical protein [Roseobacter sinensis]|uniref:Uncharacterized protein n=1 Tax=Roseobacter sinensis TaxID=2931391 RepID=A0ABT3BIC8_9RHOB|nr:hypothetical protein [Roseobacter sp. WL0113]MCV3273326.1 hypothetical protein [Roseobacter sp. WL0113]
MTRSLPKPRAGPLGLWDRLVGPGMTLAENTLVLGVSFASAGFVGLYLKSLGMDWLRVTLGAFIAFDIIGGAVCNMTDTTKRWYHRKGQRSKDHFVFIGLHVLHIACVALVFRGPGFDLFFMSVIAGWLAMSAIVVLTAPLTVKTPLAVTLYVGATGLVLYVTGPTYGLEWFVPLLFVKLLMGHAIPQHGR